MHLIYAQALTTIVVNRALGRMKQWVEILKLARAAEYPNVSPLIAFRALSLSNTSTHKRLLEVAARAHHSDDLARLANLFEVSVDGLME